MEPKRVSKLDRQFVLDLYRELKAQSPIGMVSVSELSREIAKRVINAGTGLPFHRQSVDQILTSIGERRHRAQTMLSGVPIICSSMYYPVISAWLGEHVDGIQRSFNDITVEECKGRDIYGLAPLACMLAARGVWWVFYQREPILYDKLPANQDLIVLRKIRWVREISL